MDDVLELLQPVRPHLRNIVDDNDRVDPVRLLGPVFEHVPEQLCAGRDVPSDRLARPQACAAARCPEHPPRSRKASHLTPVLGRTDGGLGPGLPAKLHLQESGRRGSSHSRQQSGHRGRPLAASEDGDTSVQNRLRITRNADQEDLAPAIRGTQRGWDSPGKPSPTHHQCKPASRRLFPKSLLSEDGVGQSWACKQGDQRTHKLGGATQMLRQAMAGAFHWTKRLAGLPGAPRCLQASHSYMLGRCWEHSKQRVLLFS